MRILCDGRYVLLDVLSEDPHTRLYAGCRTGQGGLEQPISALLLQPGAGDAHRQALAARGRNLAAVAHPNLVKVLNAEELDGQPALIHEPLSGAHLGEILTWLKANPAPLSPGQAASLVFPVAQALMAAGDATDEHGGPRPLAHGALRPHHIWLLDDGAVKLQGLGCAAHEPDALCDLPDALCDLPDAAQGDLTAADRLCLTTLYHDLISTAQPGAEAQSQSSADIPPDLSTLAAVAAFLAPLAASGTPPAHILKAMRAEAGARDAVLTRTLTLNQTRSALRGDLPPDLPPPPDMRESEGLLPRRYKLLNQLGQGGMGAVFRAVDRLTGRVVTVKRLKADALASDRAFDRLLFMREFRILASLRHPGIVSVLDFGFDAQGYPFFSMELHEGAQSFTEACRKQPITGRCELLAQLLIALVYLHRRGVLHCDLKPSNVLVVGGQVKVVDFGVSTAPELDKDSPQALGGTLAYSAPEVLSGRPPSALTDLFSVGVMAIEVLGDRHPFRRSAPEGLIYNVFNLPPDLDGLEVDGPLKAWAATLVSKDPGQRPQSADAALHQLADASREPLSTETTHSRESLLQAARLVGREAEVALLIERLNQAMRGSSQAVLIGGESGLGKSRLIQELRVHAAVSGAMVLVGQATSDARAPYEIWQRPLEQLLLDHSADATTLMVLKGMVPSIERILDVSIPSAPQVGGDDATARQLAAVQTLMTSTLHPLVIILEDLHWAGSESLALMEHLIGASRGMQVLLVGTWRDDEAPHLHKRLAGAEVMRLERLTGAAVRRLAEHMLGETNLERGVVEVLLGQSEGNPFFLIEIIRTLAEESGGMEAITSPPSPQSLRFTRLERYLARRLSRLGETSRPMLELAAVAGRQVHLPLLRQAFTAEEVERWLRGCNNSRVLEIQDGTWRFAHDKLREQLIADLAPERAKQLHMHVAEATEEEVRGQHGAEREKAAYLAYHWKMAQQPAREAPWVLMAGAAALAQNAYPEAAAALERALALKVHLHLTPVEEAALLRDLGQALVLAGRAKEGEARFAQALGVLGRPMPEGTAGWALGIATQALSQAWHLLRPPRVRSPARAVDLEAAHIYLQQLLQAYVVDDAKTIVYVSVAMQNLGETLPHGPERAMAAAGACLTSSAMALHRLADRYRAAALKAVKDVDHAPTRATVLELTSMHLMGVGRYAAAIEPLEEALELAEAGAAGRRQVEILGCLTLCHTQQGRLAQAQAANELSRVRGASHGDPLALLWAHINEAELLLRSQSEERAGEAAELMALAAPMLEALPGRVERIRVAGIQAQLALRREDSAPALAHAATGLAAIDEGSSPGAVYAIEGYYNIASALVQLSGQHTSGAHALARRAAKALAAAVKIFPWGLALSCIVEGDLRAIGSQNRAAVSLWRKARQRAITLGQPLELLIAGRRLYECGALSPSDSADLAALPLALEPPQRPAPLGPPTASPHPPLHALPSAPQMSTGLGDQTVATGAPLTDAIPPGFGETSAPS